MPDPTAADATRGQWRNPIFLLVFVPGAGAWLTVIGWLTWLYFHPIDDWIGAQNFFVREVLGTILWLAWAVFLAFGVAVAGALAEAVAGIRPSTANGRTHGKHVGWHRPN